MLTLDVPFDQFANPLVKLLFLLAVNDSAHFISLVIIQKNLLEVGPVGRLIVFGKFFLRLLKFAIEVFVIVQLVYLFFTYIPSPNMLVLFFLS